MKLTTFPKLLIILTSFLVWSCGGDKGGEGTKPNTLKWVNDEQAITGAAFAIEDNSYGNLNPNEYFALETQTYVLTLKIPQKYIDNQRHNWKGNKSISPFKIKFKSKRPSPVNFEIEHSAISPASRVTAGNFKILPKSNSQYKIEAQITICHRNYGTGLDEYETLNVYFNGTMAYAPSLSEWVDPDEELSL